jgi:hypothetical protein
MPKYLHAICEELRQLGLRPETLAARKKLEEALSSKWDGVQVAAAKSLSRWGDPRSVHSLKELLVAVAGKPGRQSTTHGVVKSLCPHLQPSDLDWLIDVFINRSRADNRLWIGGLFEAFAPNEVRRRLAAKRLHDGKAAEAVHGAIGRAEWRDKTEKKPKKD